MLIKRNHSGIAALEASLTLPIILIVIFFILEMMKVNNTQTAMDTMIFEATLEYIVTRSTGKFADIIKKYKPSHIPTGNIKYYFAVYDSLEKMCACSPYGSEEIFWPTDATKYSTTQSTYLDHDRSTTFLARSTSTDAGYKILTDFTAPEKDFGTTGGKYATDVLSNKIFVLTFVCDYNFSSNFIKKLFAGGSNTNDRKKFLVWSRGVGICN
jgi:hypothetical protein